MKVLNLRVREAFVVAIFFLYMVINFADKAVIGIVAVPVMRDLHLTPAEFGMVASSFFLLYSLSGVAFGFLANHFKAKALIIILALIWALTQFPIAWWPYLPVLVGCRILLGVGEGPAYPVAIHAAYKWFPDKRRNLVSSIIAQGAPAGVVIAAPLLSILLVKYGWRSAFIALGVVGLLWVLVWAVMGAEGTQGDDLGPGSLATSHDRSNVSARVPYALLLRDPSVLGTIVASFACYWILTMGLTWLPPYLRVGLGYSVINTGWLVSIIMGASIPLQIGAAWASQRALQKGVSSRIARGGVLGGFVGVGGICVILAMLVNVAAPLRISLIALGFALPLVAFGIGPAIIAEVTPAPQRGALLAINNSVATLAGLIAPAVTGWIIQGQSTPGLGYVAGYLCAGAILLLGGVTSLLLINPAISQMRLSRFRTALRPA